MHQAGVRRAVGKLRRLAKPMNSRGMHGLASTLLNPAHPIPPFPSTLAEVPP